MARTINVPSSQLDPEQTKKWLEDFEAKINTPNPTKVIWDGQEWAIIGVNERSGVTSSGAVYTFTLEQ